MHHSYRSDRPRSRCLHGARLIAVAAAVAAFVMATLTPVQATQRMVLAESYTNSG